MQVTFSVQGTSNICKRIPLVSTCILSIDLQFLQIISSKVLQWPSSLMPQVALCASSPTNPRGFCLSGDGKNKQALPVSEMVTNDHTLANLSFWLMTFLTKVRKITANKVSQVETDYSWDLMQGILLTFNRQDILGYLEMLCKIIKRLFYKERVEGHHCATPVLSTYPEGHLCFLF